MRKMSSSILLRKRMSSETLEDEDKWTQRDVQQQQIKIKNPTNYNKIYLF